MRLFLLLLILLCLLGCDCARNLIGVPPTLRGNYNGNLSVTYPGPDCGAITVEDSISIIFTDQTFTYYWKDDITTIAGQGNYFLESNVNFSNNIEPTTNPYLTIDGVFNIRWVRLDDQPDTLILSQSGNPEDPNGFFENIYLITLVRIEEIAD